MALIQIKKLFLRAYIGFSNHEVDKLQDVIINLTVEYDSSKAEKSDNPADALDYKDIKQRVIRLLESHRFNLLESLAKKIIDEVMKDAVVNEVTVEVDKPHALRFAESVSVILSAKRNG